MKGSSNPAVVAALIGNLLVALSKAFAAAFTGSAAMMSEAIHSAVDTSNEVLLLHGIRSSKRRPDSEHPLGYGRELYFWSFVVALLIFALGAVASVWEGWAHLSRPEPVRDPLVNYGVLALAALFEGSSWWVAYRQFDRARGKASLFEAFRRSKDPPSFVVLFEDSAALIGVVIAAAGTAAAQLTGDARFDGAASVAIGLLLGAVALLLARESKSLLIGESAQPGLSDCVLSIAGAQRGVRAANGLITVQLAPDQVVAALSVEFEDSLKAPQIEHIVTTIETEVCKRQPQVVALFVKPQTPETFKAKRRKRFGATRPH